MRTLLVSGQKGKSHTYPLPASYKYCDEYGIKAYARAVKASPPEPVVVVDMYCEPGGDYFTREIKMVAVWLDRSTGAPKRLWKGKGSFRTWYSCQVYDIPSLSIKKRRLIVSRMRGTTVGEGHDGDPCPVKKVTTKVLRRRKLPKRIPRKQPVYSQYLML